MRTLVIDNYDSFTYNLVYMLREENIEVDVFRNDKIEPAKCLTYDAMILSPGPGIPKDAGKLLSIIATCSTKVPMLGVCLGHQALAEYLGADLRLLDKVFHGVQSRIEQTEIKSPLFQNLDDSFLAARYHSWVVSPGEHKNIEVTAVAEDGSTMAIQNTDQKLYGIQFHPESILSPEGKEIIHNFLSICKSEGK